MAGDRGSGSSGKRYNTFIRDIPVIPNNPASTERIRRYAELQNQREQLESTGCTLSKLDEIKSSLARLVDSQIRTVKVENRIYRQMLEMEKDYTQRSATKDNWASDILPNFHHATKEAAKYEELFIQQTWPWPGIGHFSTEGHTSSHQARAQKEAKLEDDSSI